MCLIVIGQKVGVFGAFRDGIFRVRVAPTGLFPKDFSWAVIESAEPPPVKIDDTKDEVRITSGTTIAHIHKSPLLIDFSREVGDLLVADDPDLPMAWENGRIRVWKKMPQEEGYYGLGDKAGPMNRRDRAFRRRPHHLPSGERGHNHRAVVGRRRVERGSGRKERRRHRNRSGGLRPLLHSLRRHRAHGDTGCD